MAWIVNTSEGTSSANGPTYTPAKLPNHIAGDLLLVLVCQDIGSSLIATATTGWQNIGDQSSFGGQRATWFFKIAASDSENIPEFTGKNESWSSLIMSVRGADSSDPIHKISRGEWNNTYTANSPPLTTEVDNCLIIHAISGDGVPEQLSEADVLAYIGRSSNGEHVVAGWTVQVTAGLIPTNEWTCSLNTEGGHTWALAIKGIGDRGSIPGKISGWLKNEVIARLAVPYDLPYTVTQEMGTSIPGLSDIDGVPILDEVTTAVGRINTPSAATQSALGGFFFTPRSSFDLTDAIIAINYNHYAAYESIIGRLGILLVFVDENNNWAAFTLGALGELANQTIGNYMQWYGDVSQPPAYTNGTVDFTAIAKVGILLHHAQTTSARAFFFKNFIKVSPAVYTGGSPAAPSDLSSIATQGSLQWGYYDLRALQGRTQLLTGSAIQIGDGVTPTYLDMSGISITSPRPYIPFNYALTNYRVSPGLANIILKASPFDEILLTNCIIVAEQWQQFIIDPASSIDAEYNFSNMVLSGWKTIWKTGIPCDKASFSRCPELDAKAATFTNCTISQATEEHALALDAGGSVAGSSFTKGADTYALKLREVGTYDLSGTTFTGYTTPLHVMPVSGTVTVTLASGQAVPAYISEGATVTFAQPQQHIEVEGLATGSIVKVLRVDTGVILYTGTETDGEIVTPAIEYYGLVEVEARCSSAPPFYKPWTTRVTLSGQSVALTATQELD